MAREEDASLDACIASVSAEKQNDAAHRAVCRQCVVHGPPSHGLLHERPFVSFPGIDDTRASVPAQTRPISDEQIASR